MGTSASRFGVERAPSDGAVRHVTSDGSSYSFGTVSTSLMNKTVSDNPEVLRSVSPAQVLKNCGAILQGQKSSRFSAKTTQQGPQPISTMTAEERAQGDKLWRESTVSDQVDVFLSHVWGVPRWKKALGLYYYLNVNSAIAMSMTVWIATLVGLVSRNGFTAMGGKPYLVPALVYLPTMTFFLVLFSAHFLRPTLRLWLDKLCIHQTDEHLKQLGMEAMLETVRASNRMCIFWDETYFERLWCNAELATFCATHDGPGNIDFVPLWLPPWIITAMFLDVFCSSLAAHFAWLSQAIFGYLTSLLGAHLWVFCLAAPCIGMAQCSISYLPLLVPNYFALTTKISQHGTMFRLLQNFRHAEAKCTVESDRKIIGEHISSLFAQGNDSPAEAIARFDKFTNVDVLQLIKEKVSTAAMLPRREAFLVVLPLIFTSSAIVLSCDGADCVASAKAEMPPPPLMLDQVSCYMILNSFVYSSCSFLVFPATYPLVLQLVDRAMQVENRCAQGALVVISILVGYSWMGLGLGISTGVMLYATKYGHSYVLVVLVYVTVLILGFRWLTSVQGPATRLGFGQLTSAREATPIRVSL